MKTMSDEDLLGALRAADPASRVVLSPSEATLVVRRARPASRPRRWPIWTAALAGVLVIGVPAGAVATGFAARTGWFGSPNPGDDRATHQSTEMSNANDEWIDLGADDLADVVGTLLSPAMPLAPGVTAEDLVARTVDAIAQDDAVATETGVRRSLEHESYTDWIDAWIAAHDRGDAAGQHAAAEVLAEAADWPAMVATDGGGVTDVMRGFAARIAAGDDEAAQALAQVESAPSWDGVDRSDVVDEIYRAVTEQRG